jgi:hypothetical protein
MEMFILNLLVAIGLVWLGAYGTAYLIAGYILSNSEASILAKIREIKKEAEDIVDDYRNA